MRIAERDGRSPRCRPHNGKGVGNRMALRVKYRLHAIGSKDRAEVILADMRFLAIRHGFARVGHIEHLTGEEAVLQWHLAGTYFHGLLASTASIGDDEPCETPAVVMGFRITFAEKRDVGMWIALALDLHDTNARARCICSWRGHTDDLAPIYRADGDVALVALVDRIFSYFESARQFGSVEHYDDTASYKQSRDRAALVRAATALEETADV